MLKQVFRRRLVALGMVGALASMPGQANACPSSGLDVLLFPVLAPIAICYGAVLLGLGVAGSVSTGSVTAVGTLPLRAQDNPRANDLTVRAFKVGFFLGATLPLRIWDNDGVQQDIERAFPGERRS